MAEKDKVVLLKAISHKLDQLIVLTKMGKRKEINKIREKVKKDAVLSEILKLSDRNVRKGSMSLLKRNDYPS